ncbi:flagellar hook-associated protein FlgL [Comamonas sp.]|uniref:flagellar hook-associated protein FlgL n=1 Tax=Comamonas sp. TaxID=34028 RepID=UPI0028A22047|nr:flagellar hook-associated protein FlgL [Comamonas sp.]
MSITRLGTANMYDRTISNISKQQAELASQMEHTSAGKRVLRASDDPVAAAQAERARTRLTRMETDQRMLDAQTATIKYGESTLGEINDAVQEFRSLLVQAGNGTYNQTQRDTLVEQLTSLRDQILKYSNRTDSNGLPLFRGLDTESSMPFPNGGQGMQSGQTNSNEYTITNSLDGALAFFSGKTGNGVLAVDIDGANTGKAWADVGTITDPNATDLSATGPLTITFGEDADGNPTYSITYQQEDPANPGTFLTVPWEDANGDPVTDIAYKSGEAITVAGMKLTITGDTEVGDKFTVKPSTDQSIFDVLDQAIAEVKSNVKTDGSTDHGALAHGLAKSLAEIDTQLNRVSTVRGVAGDLLNQATRMGNTLLARNEQVEAQRVAAEDYDTDGMVKALSQLKTQETAVSAALQSYASIQKLSLFDYIR